MTHAPQSPSGLDPTVTPRARFVASRSAWTSGCGVLFLVVWATGFFGGAFHGLVGPAAPVFVATVGLVGFIFWVDRTRGLNGRPNLEVRVYPDAVAFTVRGGPWELVPLDELEEVSLPNQNLELRLARRDGRTASLPLVWLSLDDRKALAAQLEALAPGRVRGLSGRALRGMDP